MFFYVVVELKTKAEEGMFVGYNLAGVELSQTHCVLHTCAVFSLCFSRCFPLLFLFLCFNRAGSSLPHFLSCSELGLFFVGVCALLTGAASRCRAWALGYVGISGCGTRA